MPMNKNSTLIYQFNSLKDSSPIVFDLQQLLRDEEILRVQLRDLKKVRLKSPKIEVLQKM